MSEKQRKHYNISRCVMKEAWRIKRRTILYSYTFGTALRLAWATVRCRLRMIHSKVVGVTYNGRQDIIRRLAEIDMNRMVLTLEREYDNAYDSNAITATVRVRNRGRTSRPFVIGYVKGELAAMIAPHLDNGDDIVAEITDFTGYSYENMGVNFRFVLI